MKGYNDGSGTNFKQELCDLLVAESHKTGVKPGKLKEWGEIEGHDGWYYFNFEHRIIHCSASVAVYLNICKKEDGEIYIREDI